MLHTFSFLVCQYLFPSSYVYPRLRNGSVFIFLAKFIRNICEYQNKSLSLSPTKPVLSRTGRVKDIDGMRPRKPFVRSVSKRRLRTLHSVPSNFATLKRITGYNATERLRRCIICQYNITWRGLAALLILDTGQCEGLKAGMGEKLETPMPFLFPFT